MRITCPSCRAVYDVPDHLLGPGRTVRCTACAHSWVPVAESAATSEPAGEAGAASLPSASRPAEPTAARPLTAPAAAHTAEQAPEWRMPEPAAASRTPELVVPPRTPAAEPEEPQNGGGAWIGWLATMAVLVLLVWAAYTWRAEVMQAWPPSQRAYAALGLTPAAPPPAAHPAPASPPPPPAPPQPAAPQPAAPQQSAPQPAAPSGKPPAPAQAQ